MYVVKGVRMHHRVAVHLALANTARIVLLVTRFGLIVGVQNL